MSKPSDSSGRRSEVRPAGGLASEIAQTGLANICFLNCIVFLVHKKINENLTSRRILQNLTNTSPGRPKLDLKIMLERFWH